MHLPKYCNSKLELAGHEIANASTGERLQTENREGVHNSAGRLMYHNETLSWMPPTTAAMALRILSLDAALVYHEHEQAAREHKKVIAWNASDLGILH